MHRLEGVALIFIVVLLVGISVFWTNAIRHDDITPTLERLIEAGYTIEEILQHPDVCTHKPQEPRIIS